MFEYKRLFFRNSSLIAAILFIVSIFKQYVFYTFHVHRVSMVDGIINSVFQKNADLESLLWEGSKSTLQYKKKTKRVFINE